MRLFNILLKLGEKTDNIIGDFSFIHHADRVEPYSRKWQGLYPWDGSTRWQRISHAGMGLCLPSSLVVLCIALSVNLLNISKPIGNFSYEFRLITLVLTLVFGNITVIGAIVMGIADTVLDSKNPN